MEWVAFGYSAHSKPASFKGAKSFDGLQAIMGAGRVKTAGRRLKGRNGNLIKTDQSDHHLLKHVLPHPFYIIIIDYTVFES